MENKKMLYGLFAAVLLAVVVLGLAACGKNDNGGDVVVELNPEDFKAGPIEVVDGNIARNPSFEDGMADWDVHVFAVAGDVTHVGAINLNVPKINDFEGELAGRPLLPSKPAPGGGEHALYFNNPNATDGMWRVMVIQDVARVNPGEEYEITFLAKTTKTLVQGVMFVMPKDEWWDPGQRDVIPKPVDFDEHGFGNLQLDGAYGKTVAAEYTDEEWREFNFTFTVPEEWGEGAVMQIKFEGRGWADEAMLVDGVVALRIN